MMEHAIKWFRSNLKRVRSRLKEVGKRIEECWLRKFRFTYRCLDRADRVAGNIRRLCLNTAVVLLLGFVFWIAWRQFRPTSAWLIQPISVSPELAKMGCSPEYLAKTLVADYDLITRAAILAIEDPVYPSVTTNANFQKTDIAPPLYAEIEVAGTKVPLKAIMEILPRNKISAEFIDLENGLRLTFRVVCSDEKIRFPAPSTGSVQNLNYILAESATNLMTEIDPERMGHLLYTHNDFYGAVNVFTEAIERNPQQADVYYYRSLAWFRLRDWSAATNDCTKALEINHQLWNAYILRGNARKALGDPGASNDFRAVLQLKPSTADDFALRGNANNNLGLYTNAVRDYGQAIELIPKASFYICRGRVQEKLEKFNAALGDFNSAIHLKPADPAGYYYRGVYYYNRKNYLETIKEFTKVIELGPPGADPYYFRANAYKELGDYEKALSDYTEALRLDPSDRQYGYRAGLYFKLGQSANAVADYRKLIELIPNSAGYRRLFADALDKIGRLDEASGQRKIADELEKQAKAQTN